MQTIDSRMNSIILLIIGERTSISRSIKAAHGANAKQEKRGAEGKSVPKCFVKAKTLILSRERETLRYWDSFSAASRQMLKWVNTAENISLLQRERGQAEALSIGAGFEGRRTAKGCWRQSVAGEMWNPEKASPAHDEHIQETIGKSHQASGLPSIHQRFSEGLFRRGIQHFA